MNEKTQLNIALIGDYNPEVTAHVAIPKAIALAATQPEFKGQTISYNWIFTKDIDSSKVSELLEDYNAIWCVPASPYENMEGALAAIQYARENKVAFIGTCGGYQHAILDYARNVLGHREASHTEIEADTSFPLLTQLSCALIDAHGDIVLKEGSLIQKYYGETNITEEYRCSYGFNADYTHLFDATDLQISGHDATGDIRAIELKNHPFFVGVAFQPERSALQGKHHPLIRAFIKAASNDVS